MRYDFPWCFQDHKFNSADQPISEVRLEYDEDDERQTCLVQYVLFPPHSNTSRDRFALILCVGQFVIDHCLCVSVIQAAVTDGRRTDFF